MDASVLRLFAEDSEGLGVVAAAVQDALVRPQDMKFDRKSRSFGLEISRFQWELAGRKAPYFRSRAVLAFSDVHSVRSMALARDVDAVLGVLDLQFAAADEPPGGEVRMLFADGAEMRLTVECLNVTLMDIGPVWPTRRRPDHEKPA